MKIAPARLGGPSESYRALSLDVEHTHTQGPWEQKQRTRFVVHWACKLQTEVPRTKKVGGSLQTGLLLGIPDKRRARRGGGSIDWHDDA